MLRWEYCLEEAETDVRLKIAEMDRPEDFIEVAQQIHRQLRQLGVRHDQVSIQIVNMSGSDLVCIDPTADGATALLAELETPDWPRNSDRAERYSWVVDVWRSGGHLYQKDTPADSPLGAGLSALDVAFSQGTLAITYQQPESYGTHEIGILKRFARVLSHGFQRFWDIVERQRGEKALRQAKDEAETAQAEAETARAEAEAASRAKSQFLANMSHEIRTPMNAIMGMTDLVLRTHLDADQRDNLEVVRLSAQNLLDLINDILDLSRIEARGLTLEETDFSLQQILRDTTRTFAARAREKGLSLDLAMDDALPDALRGDPMRLRQILVNLIGNALKFTSAGGIEVSAFAQADKRGFELHCSVRDSGIGMSPEQQEHIFEAFAQADTSTTRRYGGSGLGLAISVNLVKLMGGRIWVDSAAGEGSTFHFTVHLEHALQDPPLAAVAQAAQDQFVQRHILLAEDNPLNQKVAVGLLREAGHEITVVNNGLEAVAALAAGTFDIVLMDVQMPEMDGFAATELIRQNEGKTGGHTPIIALTAHAMKGDRERCIAAGMDDYISKPIDRKKILSLIEGLTDREAIFAIDGEALMGRLGGEYALFVQLRDLFRESSPRLLAQMHRAVASSQFADLHTAAYELHDTIINFGADSAVRLTLALQEVTADSSGLAAMLSQLESELAQMDRALAEFESMREGLIPNNTRAMQWPRLEENTLAELRRLEQGGYFSLDDFLRQFNIDGRARIDKMRQAVVDGDTATLEREAHTLKGGSRELGARYLSELCFELEKMSREGEGIGEAGGEQVRSIAEEFEAVCNELVRRREG
jgi:signal transduction histidine kinase/DNA-binding response OmpR family regulator/HPt (histidine-containing phosphotransfer) domain-containing protein